MKRSPISAFPALETAGRKGQPIEKQDFSAAKRAPRPNWLDPNEDRSEGMGEGRARESLFQDTEKAEKAENLVK